MTVCVDGSVWFAAANERDALNGRARSLLQTEKRRLTSDHVLVETWLLLNRRLDRNAAERFWEDVRRATVDIEAVTLADLERAWAIGFAFPDQSFSIVDRTSFAVMERLGLRRALSFDNDFAVDRYGRARDKAFEIVR